MAEGKVIGEARGAEIKAEEIAKNMIINGFSYKQTAKLSGLNVKKIKALAN
jgi:DNA-binding CsgD family transcriptional regulator